MPLTALSKVTVPLTAFSKVTAVDVWQGSAYVPCFKFLTLFRFLKMFKWLSFLFLWQILVKFHFKNNKLLLHTNKAISNEFSSTKSFMNHLRYWKKYHTWVEDREWKKSNLEQLKRQYGQLVGAVSHHIKFGSILEWVLI